MPKPVQVAWLTATEELNTQFLRRLIELYPELPIVAVSEFPVETALAPKWLAYHPKRKYAENLKEIREGLRGLTVLRASVIVEAGLPFWGLRAIALRVSGRRVRFYNARRFVAGAVTARVRPVIRWARRIQNPGEALVPLYAKLAYLAARLRQRGGVHAPMASVELLSGTSVIIPSRDGLQLLRKCLPRIQAAQVLVVDNGSSDGTASALDGVEVLVSAQALSFACAINRGLEKVRYRRVLLLNNDMLAEPGFLSSLEKAFEQVPELFCATAQIVFPDGVRREETGKAVMREPRNETEFPVRCDLPLPDEDGTWVLYGSGGCSLFDTAKLRELGGLNEALAPAYVEDLDLGYRAWQRGWPSVFCARALVEHRHRSTTARYWSAAEIDTMVQMNYLRFLASAVSDTGLYRKLWDQAIRRLHLAGAEDALRGAWRIALEARVGNASGESAVLALTNGDVAVFPGHRARSGKPVVMVATPYLPFPLSHGGAVRIYNLMQEAARDFDLVMVAFAETWGAPASELLDLCCEITIVRRVGSHYRVSTSRPDMVEEFDSETYRQALRWAVNKWKPGIVQLEWTQMAVYGSDCGAAKTVLVEHDITYELYERSSQGALWKAFETEAWRIVDAVVVMSDKDRVTVGERAVVIPNGVDTSRYFPSDEIPEAGRLLFVGSFRHLPNRVGIEWFLREVWPLLDGLTLHVIAGEPTSLAAPGVIVEGFVSDVRPAYRRAALAIVPLVESAGTNIKVLEALAMGKAVVSTSAGVNGLDVPGVMVADTPGDFAAAVRESLRDSRLPVMDRRYSWSAISEGQAAFYRSLCRES